MKDEKYREWTWADIDDVEPKQKKDGTKLVWCPECKEQHRHRTLQIDTKAGMLHCWYCGVHGRFERDEQPQPSAHADTKARGSRPLPPERKPEPRSRVADLTAAVTDAVLISDYVALPDEVLDGIADISADPDERDPSQLLVRRYLQEQQIPIEAAQQMRWGVAQTYVKLKDEEVGKERTCLVYRNYVEGICCNAKYRCVTRATRLHKRRGQAVKVEVVEKGFTQESACTPTAPYNIDCIRQPRTDHETLYICEGEKDCLTLRMLGFSYVISVSNGASTDPDKTFEAFSTWLQPYSRVVICGDQDPKGREMLRNMSRYFEDREVLQVVWDRRVFGKDISDVYQRKGADWARQMVLNAVPIDRGEKEDYTDEDDLETICQMLCDPDRRDKYSLGIGPEVDRHLMLTPDGGLIIVTGTPNAGKTDFLNFLMVLQMARRDEGVCFCSFETPNKLRHLSQLSQLWIGATPAHTLTPEQRMQYAQGVTQRAHHLSMRRQRPSAHNILHRAEGVIRRHPDVRYLVIDPYLYMELAEGRNVTETEAIKQMLTMVQDWAHDHKVWVFIVAHPRKLSKDDGTEEYEEIDMYTISGSAHWANIADYLVSVARIEKDQGRTRYTRLKVLKVRDQAVCVPGEVELVRQTCGRYDERKGVACLKPY